MTRSIPEYLGAYWQRLAPLLASPLVNRTEDLAPGCARLSFAIDRRVDEDGNRPLQGLGGTYSGFKSLLSKARYSRTVRALARGFIQENSDTELFFRVSHNARARVILEDRFVTATLRVVDVRGMETSSLVAFAESLAGAFGQRLVALRPADDGEVVFVFHDSRQNKGS